MTACSATTSELNGYAIHALENEMVRLTVIPEKGADIYEWIHKPTGVDVMWKSSWGLGRHRKNPSTATNTQVAWMDGYEGGWQVLFPSGGGPSQYKGVELNFHGEASVTAWDVDTFAADEARAILVLSSRLARSPFRIERTMTLEAGSSSFLLEESVTNEGGEAMDYMWGHHPAYGEPLLSASTRIDTNATRVTYDDKTTGPNSPAGPGETFEWPMVGPVNQQCDLSSVPGPDESHLTMAYLHDFHDPTAWYAISNPTLGVGAGLAWEREALPCAWFWQEMNASAGFPFYKGVYVMAIEPNTSFPGHGLTTMTEKTGMQRTLRPGEHASIRLRAVLFETQPGAASIGMDGVVTQR